MPPPLRKVSPHGRVALASALALSLLLNALLGYLVYLGRTFALDAPPPSPCPAGAQPPAAETLSNPGQWSEEVFQQLLERAEEAYQRHQRLKSELVGTAEELTWPPFTDAVNQALEKQHPFLGTMESSRVVFRTEYLVLPRYPCFEEERMGRWGEGGKWVCWISLHKPPKDLVVYSVGSNMDSTFEAAVFHRLGARSHTFDPFVPPREGGSEFLTFYNIGLAQGTEEWVEDGTTHMKAPVKSIHRIMKDLGHSFIDLLKVDCEGCEAGFVEGISKTTTRDSPVFGQLLMEIHNINNVTVTSRIMTTLRTLGFRLFHQEPNFFEPWKVCEVAFIHETFVKPKRPIQLF